MNHFQLTVYSIKNLPSALSLCFQVSLLLKSPYAYVFVQRLHIETRGMVQWVSMLAHAQHPHIKQGVSYASAWNTNIVERGRRIA